jgi:hypothetical protein
MISQKAGDRRLPTTAATTDPDEERTSLNRYSRTRYVLRKGCYGQCAPVASHFFAWARSQRDSRHARQR